MPLQKISEVEQPEIGKFYLVPTVRGRWFGIMANWPVLGPKHEDAAIIGFDREHYHLDGRFVAERLVPEFHDLAYSVFNSPLNDYDISLRRPPYHDRQVLDKPVWRRRLYRRHMPDYPRYRAPWMRKLEGAYKDHRLKAGLVCPHRGAPLRGLPVDAAGCVTCPLHGLRWNVKTGELVRDGDACN